MIKRIIKKTFLYPILAQLYDYSNKNFNILKFSVQLFFAKFKTDIIFFFPFYSTGGAEKVHLNIVKVIKEKRPVVFFTGSSINEHFKSGFYDTARCYEIYFFIRDKGFARWLFKKTLICKLNRIQNLKIFGCNSQFYYELIPELSPKIRIVDLIHAFTDRHEPGAEKWSLSCAGKINTRVVINDKTKHDLIEQYRDSGLPEQLNNKIKLIYNKISIPASNHGKTYDEELNILYVGRKSEEKRVNLVARIACMCFENNINSKFYLIGGDLEKGVEKELHQYCNFTGAVMDENILMDYYQKSHILLLTSSREGFPMVIMEALANGVIPVSANVGGIPEHVKHGVTGLLIEHVSDEQELIIEAFEYIKRLNEDRDILMKMSKNAYFYAGNNFSEDQFNKKYKELLA